MSFEELDYSKLETDKKPGWLWKAFIRIASTFDAEHVHEWVIALLKIKSHLGPNALALGDESLSKDVMGLRFKNPIGLAAGFDVNGECVPALQALGFGFIEVGGTTEHPNAGSARPRLFRLPEDRALINRLNFFNKGVKRLRKNLIAWRNRGLIHVPIGVNLGKSQKTSLEQAPDEYARIFKQLWDVADYVTINVSCPYAEGVSSYQTANSLGCLLDALCNINENLSTKVPLLLKLGPDLSNEEAVACAEIALDYRLAGLVISNATVKHNGLLTTGDFGPGGLSGQPLFERSTQLLRCVAKDYGGKLSLIGSGGIMDGAAALAKLNAGADLLQVYSGLVYGGPDFVPELLNYLRLHYLTA